MPSFTTLLVESDQAGYKRATQPQFLAAAAAGKVPKEVLGQWLANERLFLHAYIKGVGRLISSLQLPHLSGSAQAPDPVTEFLDLSVEGLANARPEEVFLTETASKYGININLPAHGDDWIAEGDKIEGLRRFEALFGSITCNDSTFLPWLESAVLFYATDKIYTDAWKWARSQLESNGDGTTDLDDGILRQLLIPRWSNPEWDVFVERLGKLIDDSVDREVALHQEGIKHHLSERAREQWKLVLTAEETFWPKFQAVQ
ncbi:unnamed protein product [Clonostachys rosea]|uniref:Thiaminase-2/PQQC domain-containing protein n=1 Tax=Bionectria ochroleuca TaxID=29856 RepID=A0ABY6U9M3_BIOOC|nr:unnamed protein product [Clonostachys rosea]